MISVFWDRLRTPHTIRNRKLFQKSESTAPTYVSVCTALGFYAMFSTVSFDYRDSSREVASHCTEMPDHHDSILLRMMVEPCKRGRTSSCVIQLA